MEAILPNKWGSAALVGGLFGFERLVAAPQNAIVFDQAEHPSTTCDCSLRPSMKSCRALCLAILVTWVLSNPTAAQPSTGPYRPDFVIKEHDVTVLMAVDAELNDGLKPWQSGGHGKFFVTGWQQSQQQAVWQVHSLAAHEYELAILLRSRDSQPLTVEVTAAGQTIRHRVVASPRRWDRVWLNGRLQLPEGTSQLSVCLLPDEATSMFSADVHAIELVRPQVREQQEQQATAMRADAEWFRQARYGVMVHWTNQSMPLHGERKSYEQAVDAFDVASFVDQAQATGAGFVVFTTSHAYQYFPAPLQSLDKILPGRTTRRDLIGELADELQKRNMRLMLYYHLGTFEDTQWLQATKFWDTDTSELFRNWQAIVGEAGERYGNRLAGWWFDDGVTTYYYRSPPWQSLAQAAKAGNANRLISFNAWELSNPTLFHDYCTGEGCENPSGMDGLLTLNSNGIYPSGTHANLQASACLITESNWLHRKPHTGPAPPRWNADQLSDMLVQFMAYRNVPIFNFEVTQEGLLNPETVALFKEVKQRLDAQSQ